MKTFTTTMGRLSALVLLLFVSTNLFAQVFRVYTKDGLHQEYAAENVDSIVFFTQPSDEPSDNPDPILPEPVLPDMHEAVDLGLSVKWATCNVGASSPEEYGDYFAWGETTTKSSYTDSNSATDGVSDSELQFRGITSYGNLTAAYDAATANWGSKWRMPTRDEIKELNEECTWVWTTQSGVEGCKVTGPNGNSIFLPAAGNRDGTDLYLAGSYGDYWSAAPFSDSYSACTLGFSSGGYDWGYNFRSYGRSVRPVSD